MLIETNIVGESQMANQFKRISQFLLITSIAVYAAGCAATQPGIEREAQTIRKVETIDPFTLAIDAERWTVMMDNASMGATAAALENRPSGGYEERDMRYRIDFALRSGVRQLLALRDSLCVDGHSIEVSCNSLELPGWVTDAPAPMFTSLEEFQARSDWMGEQIAPLVSIGCELGKNASNDEMFCAVE